MSLEDERDERLPASHWSGEAVDKKRRRGGRGRRIKSGTCRKQLMCKTTPISYQEVELGSGGGGWKWNRRTLVVVEFPSRFKGTEKNEAETRVRKGLIGWMPGSERPTENMD